MNRIVKKAKISSFSNKCIVRQIEEIKQKRNRKI